MASTRCGIAPVLLLLACIRSSVTNSKSVLLQIVLVIILSPVEFFGGFDGSYNWSTELAAFVGLFFCQKRCLFLFRVRKKDYGAVLISNVRTLPIECCWIVIG